ncbi:9724_t:CDS:2 [Entrophospora sp. SA101]|nr:9724_t:CDS:2 [Entrophospora sp. SA101]
MTASTMPKTAPTSNSLTVKKKNSILALKIKLKKTLREPKAEPFKVLIQKTPQEQASDFTLANQYLAKLLRQVRLKVESRSPSYKTISSYLAKYLSKSFHLRELYQDYGFQKHNKAYRFFKNLYQYDQKPVLLIGCHKLDAATGQHLPRNQKVFRHYNYQTQATTYFYRANEQLVGQVRKPFSDKKHFRLGTRSLNPLSLLNLATKHHKKEAYLFKKPKKPAVQSDFQEFLIIRLLLMCKSAEFTHIPLEQDQVPKETGQCAGTIYTHFTTKPVLRFTFQPEQATVVRSFIAKLDTYALEYDMTESKDFTAYPITHDHQHQTTQQLDGLCDLTCQKKEVANSYQINTFFLKLATDLLQETKEKTGLCPLCNNFLTNLKDFSHNRKNLAHAKSLLTHQDLVEEMVTRIEKGEMPATEEF